MSLELYGEVKLVGDAYSGGFSCGMSMTSSQTVNRLGKVEEDDNHILYRSEDGIKLEVVKKYVDNVVRVHTVLTNEGDKQFTAEMLASFAIAGVCADKIHRLQSFWSAEGKLRTESITDLHLEPSWNRCGTRIEKFGNVGSMPVRKYFPFLALENSKTGEFIGIMLYCASSWQMELLCKNGDFLNVVGGLADRDFGHWMKNIAPGESFESPEAVIAEGKSLYEVCDKLVKAQHPDISPVDNNMDIMYNEYCTTWGNPSFENVKKIADKIEGKGVKYLVIDSGWYGDGEYWWERIGDWDVNEKIFPGGMKPIADYIRSKGMIPGLWFEMESVANKCIYYNDTNHIVKKDGVPLTVGDKRFWDMEDPWVIDYLSRKVIGLLKECGFGYLKVDYNDTIGIGCDGAESLGEALRRKINASREFFKKIKREIPDIVIENCSSGGHRLEPSMMEVASQASFSDAHEITSIPLIAANMHRVIKPEQSQIWAVLRAKDTPERIYYSMTSTLFGRMCLSGEIYDLSDEQWKLVNEGMDFYKKASDIIKDGTTILQDYTTQSYNDPVGSQLVIRRLGNRSLAVIHRFRDSKDIDMSFLDGCVIEAEYGNADKDFSAKAIIFTKNEK